MSNRTRAIVFTAGLAAAPLAAHASISQPSTGSSDAILFASVVNSAGTYSVASYAGDTGISIATLANLLPGTYITVLNDDVNLTRLFAADAPGDSIYWAVLGGQYTGQATIPNLRVPGVGQFITTLAGDSTRAIGNTAGAALTHFAAINQDIANINANSNGANSVYGTNPSTAGIWDYTNTSGLAYWDGGAVSNGNALSDGAQSIYYVTAGTPVATATRVAYAYEGTASLTLGGLQIFLPYTLVPTPAAIWLLLSAVGGLLLFKERREIKAAAQAVRGR